MIQWINKHLKKNKGFTLIEMMVVLVIIALLILIALPAWQSYIDAGDAVYQDASEKIGETDEILSNIGEPGYTPGTPGNDD